MSQYDIPGLYQFLLHTPEQGLRKMLVDNKPMSEVHFNLLMKVVKTCTEESFSNHFEKADFPKVKMGPAETKLKAKFWADCTACFNSRGLLSPAQKAAA
jgi:hypothetical protein